MSMFDPAVSVFCFSPIDVAIVDAKDASSLIAAASSLRVSRSSGAPFTMAETALSAYDSAADCAAAAAPATS